MQATYLAWRRTGPAVTFGVTSLTPTAVLAAPVSSADKEALVRARLAALPEVLVAFSAGVDSTYLLDLAHEVLGDRVTAVTADSPSLARTSLREAQDFCAARGIRHTLVATQELDVEGYRANEGLRCYHCKSALLGAMRALGAPRGAALLVGVIADDLGDVRPGLQASRENGALWPLADAGFTKDDVRERSRARSLATWDRPAEPCLSSRVPYGETVTPEVLAMIEKAEVVLHSLGLRECRARHHRVGNGRGHLCRIEVPESDLATVVARRAELLPALKAIGYVNVALDLAPLQSGGLNVLLTARERVLLPVARAGVNPASRPSEAPSRTDAPPPPNPLTVR